MIPIMPVIPIFATNYLTSMLYKELCRVLGDACLFCKDKLPTRPSFQGWVNRLLSVGTQLVFRKLMAGTFSSLFECGVKFKRQRTLHTPVASAPFEASWTATTVKAAAGR
jgi:hypothetical protein